MNTNMKVFSIFCFTVFFFIACSKKESDQVPVAGPTPGAIASSGAAPGAAIQKAIDDKRVTIDTSTLNPEEKTKLEADASEVVQLMGMLREAGGILTEVSQYYWKHVEIEANVRLQPNAFTLFHMGLRQTFNESNGLPLKETGATCNYRYKVEKTEQEYLFFYFQCATPADKTVVARIHRVKASTGSAISFVMDYEKGRALTLAVGKHLACVGQNEKCVAAVPKCSISGQGNKVNDSIVCKDLGQDLEKTNNYLKISSLKFDRKNLNPVDATATIFTDLDIPLENSTDIKFVGPLKGAVTVVDSTTAAGSAPSDSGQIAPTDSGADVSTPDSTPANTDNSTDAIGAAAKAAAADPASNTATDTKPAVVPAPTATGPVAAPAQGDPTDSTEQSGT